MAVFAGPKIIKDNLVMYMDKDNAVRSWKGKPTTNLVDPDFRNWSIISANVSLYKNYSNVTRDAIYRLEDDNASRYEYVQNNLTIPNDSTTYTISVYILKNHPDFDRQSEIAFNTKCQGGTQVSVFPRIETDTWTTSSGTVEDIGEYVRWSHQITNNSSGNTTLTFPLFPASGPNGGSDNSSNTGAIFVSGIQVEANDFATPFVDGTRSTTDAFIDPLNGIRFNSGNLDNYNADGSFDFDGDSDFLYVNTASEVPVLYHKDFTLEAWVKRSETGRHDEILGDYQYGWLSFRINNSNKVTLSLIDYIEGEYAYPGISGNTTINAGEWYHVVVTWVYGSESRVYVNGRLDKVDSETYGSGVSGSGRGPRYIGRTTTGAPNAGNERYFKGDIGMVKVYEGKALTADEVVTNFEASRDRYGV